MWSLHNVLFAQLSQAPFTGLEGLLRLCGIWHILFQHVFFCRESRIGGAHDIVGSIPNFVAESRFEEDTIASL